jgi:hypothetical protein
MLNAGVVFTVHHPFQADKQLVMEKLPDIERFQIDNEIPWTCKNCIS